MNRLGIYFGPQLISIVETKGNKIINHIQVSQARVSAGELLEEKVPLPVKLTALLKDELMKNEIEANEAIVSISGKDLIVRTFEMPILPRQELESAVNFEVKKYIPFKIEDLFSDFQYKLDKTIQKTRVLFIGIKKEALDNYLKILSQLDIKIKSIEYSAFSILRLLRLTKVKEKGIIAVVNIDITKDDEANFVVLESGFPLFSRDISLMGGDEGVSPEEEAQSSTILEKLKREIRISLDYYNRKFPGKTIDKVFLITNPDYWTDLEGFIKESGLAVQSIDISKYIGRTIPFSLPFVKGYICALPKIKTEVKINLLLAKERGLKKIGLERMPWTPLLALLKANARVVGLSFFICIAVFIFGVYRLLPLQKDLQNLINMRPAVSTVSANLGYEELVAINSTYKKKIETADNIIRKRLSLTALFDALPRVIPKGLWLVNLSFEKKEGKAELILEGMAYSGDQGEELVNLFVSRLKENPAFAKSFKEISLVSTERSQRKKIGITTFKISCRDYIRGTR